MPRPAAGRSSIGPAPRSGHADRRGRRPKAAKLASNTQLRRYVQDRLSGAVERPDRFAVHGPKVEWIGRRQGRRKDREGFQNLASWSG